MRIASGRAFLLRLPLSLRFAVAWEGLPRLYFLVCTGPANPLRDAGLRVSGLFKGPETTGVSWFAYKA
jgi:hypothetical protein